MEMKKYLSGAVLLVLISSAIATGEEASFATKTKDFYNKNKTAVVATVTGLSTATVAAVIGGLAWYNTSKPTDNTKIEKNINLNNARIHQINDVELKKEGLSLEDAATLKAEVEKLNKKNDFFTKKCNLNLDLDNLNAQIKELDAPVIVPAPGTSEENTAK